MAAAKLFIVVVSLAVAGCAGAQSDFDALMERVDQRDACIAAVEQELSALRQQQMAASDIRSFVSDVLGSFPPSVRGVFAQAAADAMDDIRANGREDGDKRILMLRLREVTRQAFASQFYPAIENCGSAAVELVPNFIYRYRHLDRPPMAGSFAKIGLADSFWVEQSVLLMLVLEESGVEWQPEWFSEIASLN